MEKLFCVKNSYFKKGELDPDNPNAQALADALSKGGKIKIIETSSISTELYREILVFAVVDMPDENLNNMQ